MILAEVTVRSFQLGVKVLCLQNTGQPLRLHLAGGCVPDEGGGAALAEGDRCKRGCISYVQVSGWALPGAT